MDEESLVKRHCTVVKINQKDTHILSESKVRSNRKDIYISSGKTERERAIYLVLLRKRILISLETPSPSNIPFNIGVLSTLDLLKTETVRSNG